MSKPYIWYSGATDITAKKLAATLGCSHGAVKPKPSEADIVICWGAKTKDNTVFPAGVVVLNHPDKIRDNRNKLLALETMKAAEINVENFCQRVEDIGKAASGVKLPAIGRTKYHQGGKRFWMCPSMTHAKSAYEEGANYFQNMIEIQNEYRVHVFGGKAIYSVQKVKRTSEEMEAAFIEDELARQKSLAEKAGEVFSEAAVLPFLKRQAKKFAADGANTMIRSNRLGWKFKRMKSLPKDIEMQAISACKALGLDFGAVDMCTDPSGKVWVIEVNTGPGLEESTFTSYVEVLKDKLKEITDSRDKAKKAAPLASKAEAVAKTMTAAAGKTTVPKGSTTAENKKSSLLEKVKLMREMTEVASEEEASVLNKVFGKMFTE